MSDLAERPLRGGPDVSSLGEYLRARRDLRRPEAAGLPADPRRRVPGLRRDEVADLAGISPDYYLKLEQGKVPSPSDQVLESIARALGLDEVAVEHMLRLRAGGAAPGPRLDDVVVERLQALLDEWPTTPAYVLDRHLDLVAANAAMVAVSGGLLIAGSNALLVLFSSEVRHRLRDWATVARSAVGAFRLESDPASPRRRELLEQLCDDPDFVRFWDDHEVARPSTFVLETVGAGVGPGRIQVQNLLVPEMPGLRITVYHRTTDRPPPA